MKRVEETKTLIFSWMSPMAKSGSGIILKMYLSKLNNDQINIISEKTSNEDKDRSRNIIFFRNPITFFKKGTRFIRPIIYFFIFPYYIFRSLMLSYKNTETILAIYPNNIFLILGYIISILKGKKLNIWMHNLYADNTSTYTKFIHNKIEKLIFKKSKKIFVISEALKNHYEIKYQLNNIHILRHGFKRSSISPLQTFTKKNKRKNKLCITGTLNASNLEATNRILSILVEKHDFIIDIYGNNSPSIFNLELRNSKKISFKGFLSDKSFFSKISNYDFHILTHGFYGYFSEAEYKTIFPTRVIPLLNSGIPIIAHCPKECFLSDELIKYQAAYVINSNIEQEINLKLKNIFDIDTHELVVKNAYNYANKYDLNKNIYIFKDALGLEDKN